VRALSDCSDGGRDRDRTCDPYHVKVVALTATTENAALVAARKIVFGTGSLCVRGLRFSRTREHYILSRLFRGVRYGSVTWLHSHCWKLA
jgi:hypothetical protein